MDINEKKLKAIKLKNFSDKEMRYSDVFQALEKYMSDDDLNKGGDVINKMFNEDD